MNEVFDVHPWRRSGCCILWVTYGDQSNGFTVMGEMEESGNFFFVERANPAGAETIGHRE